MNLTVWADAQGSQVQTAYRWYREGTLPLPEAKVGRLILVSLETATEAARKTEGAGLYVRVPWHEQKSGLGGQMVRLSAWAAEAWLPVEATGGSRMNGSRAKVRRLLPDPAVTVVVVGDQDLIGQVTPNWQRLPHPCTAAA